MATPALAPTPTATWATIKKVLFIIIKVIIALMIINILFYYGCRISSAASKPKATPAATTAPTSELEQLRKEQAELKAALAAALNAPKPTAPAPAPPPTFAPMAQPPAPVQPAFSGYIPAVRGSSTIDTPEVAAIKAQIRTMKDKVRVSVHDSLTGNNHPRVTDGKRFIRDEYAAQLKALEAQLATMQGQ